MDEQAYSWNGPDGKVRVTIVGDVRPAASNSPFSDSHSVAMNEPHSGDMVKVKYIDGPDKGRVRVAFRGELTPIADGGTGAHSA
jgi:hypothetical protein